MENPFTISCNRIGRRSAYSVEFQFHTQVVERIKELPTEMRKWSASNNYWELTTQGLYNLIKKYKGSNKIYFDFGSQNNKNFFINQIKKIEIEEKKKIDLIAELTINKKRWVELKNEYE